MKACPKLEEPPPSSPSLLLCYPSPDNARRNWQGCKRQVFLLFQVELITSHSMNSPAGTSRSNTNNYINAQMFAYAWQSFSRYHLVSVSHSSSTPGYSWACGFEVMICLFSQVLVSLLGIFQWLDHSQWNMCYSFCEGAVTLNLGCIKYYLSDHLKWKVDNQRLTLK